MATPKDWPAGLTIDAQDWLDLAGVDSVGRVASSRHLPIDQSEP